MQVTLSKAHLTNPKDRADGSIAGRITRYVAKVVFDGTEGAAALPAVYLDGLTPGNAILTEVSRVKAPASNTGAGTVDIGDDDANTRYASAVAFAATGSSNAFAETVVPDMKITSDKPVRLVVTTTTGPAANDVVQIDIWCVSGGQDPSI